MRSTSKAPGPGGSRGGRVAVLVLLVLATIMPATTNAATDVATTHGTLSAASTAPRRVNVWPATGPVDSNWNTASLFWFGQATSSGSTSSDYVDVRVAYDSQNLYVNATTVDYYLWYDQTGATDPRTYDAFAVYLDTRGDGELTPQSDDYFFVSGFHDYPSGNDVRWHRQGQGTGTGWNEAWAPSPAWTDDPGDRYYNSGPNNNSDLDAGWTTTMTIPWATLGLSGPPSSGTSWGIGATLYNRNDAPPAPSVAPESWPETFASASPATWADLAFAPAAFHAPAATNVQTITLRRGLNNEAVQDAYVGGGGNCAGGIYGGGDTAHPTDNLFVQNEADVSDFPCFSKSFLQFDLSAIPPGKVITSASLTIYQFGNSDPTQAQPSYIQLYRVVDPWSETTLTWNNEPLATENLTGTVVNPLATTPPWPGVAATWDASQLVADAYGAAQPANLALYESDTAYHSGKYFTSSDTGDWNANGRPTLTVSYGDPSLALSMSAAPEVANQNDTVTCTLQVSGAGLSTQVSAVVPSQFTFVAGSATNGATFNSSTNTVQWSGAPAPGTTTTISFQVKASSSAHALVPFTASASATGGATATSSSSVLLNPYDVSLPVVK